MSNQNNRTRISTKEELHESLSNYKGVLTKKTMSYLEALINLEFSVIKDIDANDRNALSELEIYRKIAIYNIYNRALNLFQESGIPYGVNDNEFIDGLNINYSYGNNSFELFKFDYEQGFTYGKVDEYTIPRIGVLSMYHTIESKEQREKEIKRIEEYLRMISQEDNPYKNRPSIYNGAATSWDIDRDREIKRYEEKLGKLSNSEITLKDEKEIEITGLIYNQLLQDYGLTEDDFEIGKSNSLRGNSETEMKRTLVKTMPKLTIKTNIKYI